MLVGLDFETYSPLSISDVGMDNYVSHPLFTPLLASVAYRTGSKFAASSYDLILGEEEHARLHVLIAAATLAAHNAGFERRVLNHLFPQTRFYVQDSAALARCAGATGNLEGASAQLLDTGKLEVGKALIQKFCTGDEPPPPEIIHDPDWPAFREYCERDAINALKIRLQFDIQRERTFEPITHRMNETGWYVDQASVDLMVHRAELNKEKALAEFRAKHDPNGDLNLSSLKQLKEWCRDRKIQSNSFDELNVERIIGLLERKPGGLTEGQAAVLDMLRTKQILGGSALKKLPVIQRLTSTRDGRLRGQYIHCGAAQSHRTSGVGVQMQNLKRLHDPKDLSTLADPTVEWTNDDLANNMRQLFTAEHPQGELIVGDFASVESRGLAYMAGAQWKLDAFHNGKDMYKVLAAKIYPTPYEQITKEQRTTGKVGELSCGYGAGGPAVADFAKKMHVDMTLPQATQLVSDWRTANPEVVDLWKLLDDMLHQSMGKIGSVITRELANELSIAMYPTPSLPSVVAVHPGAIDLRIEVRYQDYYFFGRMIRGLYYRGRQICFHKPSQRKGGDLWSKFMTDPKTKQRKYFSIYGGKLTGILVQSMCREIFFDALREVEGWAADHDLKLIGQFHDEIVVEWSPDSPLDLESAKVGLTNLMRETMLRGFPLDAEVNSDHRYIK